MDGNLVQQFKKGSLELILLCLIARGETYGYAIIAELNAGTAGILGYAREGTVYPILYRLQAAGLIQSRLVPAAANGREKKYYSLTEDGRKTLEEMVAFWADYRTCVDSFIQRRTVVEETA